jgi:gephyrin
MTLGPQFLLTTVDGAISTVSDTAAADAGTDKSGPLLRSIVEHKSGFLVHSTDIVPDSHNKITEYLARWLSEGVNLILTTGGTGFGVRDITPEVNTLTLIVPVAS